jgi:hypothetical protein
MARHLGKRQRRGILFRNIEWGRLYTPCTHCFPEALEHCSRVAGEQGSKGEALSWCWVRSVAGQPSIMASRIVCQWFRRSRIGRRASAHSGHLGHISNPLSLLVNEQIRVPHDVDEQDVSNFELHA